MAAVRIREAAITILETARTREAVTAIPETAEILVLAAAQVEMQMAAEAQMPAEAARRISQRQRQAMQHRSQAWQQL